MNALKDLYIFCKNHDLDPWNPASWKAMEREGAEVVKIDRSRPLTWTEVESLTGGATGTFTVPCPFCGPDLFSSTRFQIQRPSLNRVEWRCFYCGESGSLRKKGSANPEQEAKARQLAEERDRERKAVNGGTALRIWDESMPIARTPVLTYLEARAIYDLPPNVDDVLRYHPQCPFGKNGTAGCMIALLRDVLTDKRVAIHRTWITRQGKTHGRKALGPLVGAAVKLWPLDGDRLTIGEGIETVLAAATRDDIIKWREPLRPAWAATVALSLARFPVIASVRQLRILVDNDATQTGQVHSETCAVRWARAGKTVVRLTPVRGQGRDKVDFNDLVREAPAR